METKYFGLTDLAVFVFMLLISAAIGIYFAIKGQNSANQMLMGGKSMRVIPVSVSITATFLSSIGLLGWPAELYLFGAQYHLVHLLFSMPFAILICAKLFVPVFFNLGITSCFQYLELRFSRLLRTVACIIYCINTIIYMGVVLYGPALALSQVTAINMWTTIIATGFVCTFYTAIVQLGGLKAVVWTDVFQTLVIISSLFYVTIKGIVDNGGLMHVINDNLTSKRLEMFNMSLDPTIRTTFCNVFFGGIFVWIQFYGINQSSIQRYNSLKDVKSAERCMWLVLPLKISVYSIVILCGLTIYSKYSLCDPISTKQVTAADQLFPLFVMETLSFIPGIVGLFVAGIFSASLSTISSGINSLTAVILEDIVKIYINAKISDSTATTLLKILAVFFGFMTIAAVLVADSLGNIIQTTNIIFGLIWSPMVALFSLGIFVPRVQSVNATIGLIFGFAFNLWIGIGSILNAPYYPRKTVSVESCIDLYTNKTGLWYNSTTFGVPNQHLLRNNENIFYLFRISFLYYNLTGFAVTMIAAILSSYFIGNMQPRLEMDINLYSPFLHRHLNPKVGKSESSFESEKSIENMDTKF
ncbi:sodium-coupled monocarboxylate transporter 1-like protein [Leptotrombidium deliense]|uniref:Sodium-coupled monocarboxylate transporter 1-like protein n=1 Tax=Leptotrombidium deliense TaxID=299467 RepID=A0A443SA64_9ACAR|nr:sodium-coupled monocarboxylate transporter 1-like protein [Leptotrombidium deliense]